MKRRKKGKKHIRRFTAIHGVITLCFLALYLGIGAWFDFSLVLSDIEHKSKLAGAVVSATVRVWGPPSQPVASLSTGCSSGNSYVVIDWDDDENSTSYDIFRNGAELITGLVASFYQDNNTDDVTTYSYYVIAYGPEGDETSATESITTNDCPALQPDPEITITRFEDYDLLSHSSAVVTGDRKPEFYGTSNQENATVRAELLGDPIIISTTTTNINGYWSWTPPSNLSAGLHTIYFTVIDPTDSNRTATDSLTFRITKEEEGEDDDDQAVDEVVGPTQSPLPPSQPQEAETEKPEIEEQAPINLDLEISQVNAVNVQGQDLITQVYPGYSMTFEITIVEKVGIEQDESIAFVYSVLDLDGEEVYRMSEQRNVKEGESFTKRITLPKEIKPGKYKFRTEAIVGDYSVSEERYFIVESGPLVALQTNFFNFIQAFLSDLGWLVIILILILIILIILAIIEHKMHRDDESGGMFDRFKRGSAH